MNEPILENKKVTELCQYIDNDKLYRFIESLPKYKIITLGDLMNVQETITDSMPGFGKKKWNLLQEARRVLDKNIDTLAIGCHISENIVSFDDKNSLKKSHNAPEHILSIPIDWLLNKNMIEECYTSIVSNTLKGNTIQDILNLNISQIKGQRGVGERKLEQIIKLQEAIETFLNVKDGELETIYNAYIKTQTIPELPSAIAFKESKASSIKRFIDEIIQLYQEKNKHDIADAIQLAYKHGFERNLVAINKQKSDERIRQWLTSTKHESFIGILRKIVSGASKSQFYTLSYEFRRTLEDIEQFCKKTPLKKSLEEFLGDGVNNNIIDFILHYVGAKIFGGSQGQNTRIKEEFIVVDCNKNLIDHRKWGEIFRLLDTTVKPLEKERLILHLHKKFKSKSNQIDCIITSIIENSNQFEYEKNNLVTTYMLKWDELLSMQTRIERLLYEHKEAMNKGAIEEEYNKRLKVYGLSDPDVFHIKASKNILQLYEGGTWIWKEYSNESKPISRQQLIQQYAAEKQIFTLDEIMTFLKQKNIPSLNERSIKTMLAKLCISTTEGYYIDKNSREDFSNLHKISSDDIVPELVKIMDRNKEYTYKELGTLYKNSYKISVPDSKIRKACNNSNVFIIISGSGRRTPHRVKVNPTWNGEHKTKITKLGIKATWKQNVREESINKLRYSPNYEMESSELCKHLKSFIPKNISATGLYKIFKEESIFYVKKGNKGRNIIALNIEEWEREFKQHLSDNTDGNSTYQYEETNYDLKEKQRQQLKNPLYNMSTQTNVDIDNLRSSTKTFIFRNLQTLESENMGICNFEDVWSYMIEKMNIRNGGTDNAYYRMLNQLYSYMFGSTTRTDRYYLWVEMRLNFEPYLKQLLSLKGLPIQTDGRDLQLHKLIELCQQNNIFPQKDERCHITSCIGHMLSKRNFKGHNAENTPSDTLIIQNIQKEITLYLYTSMQLK